MKKIISFVLCFTCLYAQAQVVKGFYRTYKGNVMGAETVIHLHIVKNQAMGSIYLLKDPRPFFIYGTTLKGDSIFLSGSRSMATSMELSGTIRNGIIKGAAKLTLEDKVIRSGEATLQVDSSNYTSFDFYNATSGAGLPASLKNESRCELAAATIWPKANDSGPLAVLVQKNGLTFFSQKTNTNPLQFLTPMHQQKIKTWRAENVKAFPKGAADMGLSLSMDEDLRYLVLNENNTCINFIQYAYGYSGGAHGNAGSDILAIDKRNNKQLQLADVLNPAGIKTLPSLLEKAARSQFGIAANAALDDRLLVKTIQPAKQFFVTGAGIGFWYNAYEIASYADGDVVLFIPFSSIAKYLQPSFIKK